MGLRGNSTFNGTNGNQKTIILHYTEATITLFTLYLVNHEIKELVREMIVCD